MSEEFKSLPEVLKEKFPEFTDESGELHFATIGKELGRTRQAMHSSIWRNNRITAEQARHLIGISKGRLTADEIIPYIA